MDTIPFTLSVPPRPKSLPSMNGIEQPQRQRGRRARLLVALTFLLLLAGGGERLAAFSLLGPKEAYHIPTLGFSADFSDAPHNLGEEYRWNIPVLFYAYDQNFLDYFGSNGVAAIDRAVGILNDLPRVSEANLDDFPLDEARYNNTAAALHLFDLGSTALEVLVEHLGLANPEDFTWNLRVREPVPPGCPNFIYGVIQRNFDANNLTPAPFVNGNLFTYVIDEFCPTPDQAVATEIAVDPFSTIYSAVASVKLGFASAFYYGMYHTGLTRDDMAGLRYLYAQTNVNPEVTAPDVLFVYTNRSAPTLLVTSNLTLLAAGALTNDAAAIQGLYPGLIVSSTTPFFTNVITTNLFPYLTNYPWDPVGTPPWTTYVTNYDTNIQVVYRHTFQNVVTNYYTNRGIVTIMETNITQDPHGLPGVLRTNATIRNVLTNIVMGDFYIFSTNIATTVTNPCGYDILSNLLTKVTTTTNLVDVNTNLPTGTNVFGFTNVVVSRSYIYYFTSHVFAVYPVECIASNTMLRRGIEKIAFARRDYDSLLGQFWYPLTTNFNMIGVTNSTNWNQSFQRVVTTPDILFSAQDLIGSPALLINPTVARPVPGWSTNTVLPGLAGPGTIIGSGTFTFNKGGPVRVNQGPLFMEEVNSFLDFAWATFDGTTNAPFVFPHADSIRALESQIIMQVTTVALPEARVGAAYATTNGQPVMLTGLGGEPPYLWSLSPASPGLPAGLQLYSDGSIIGTPGPGTEGTYDVTVRLTDISTRYVERDLVLVVRP